MKDDELQFLRIMQERCTVHPPDYGPTIWRESPRDIINSDGFPLHHKRAWFILEKWCGRLNWYEFGVSLDLGWLTTEGMNAMRERPLTAEEWEGISATSNPPKASFWTPTI